jgi:O-succinylhomoserine sulfhydrylase
LLLLATKRGYPHQGQILNAQLNGGKKHAWKLIDATEMISITANPGDVKTTITHPVTTTHGRLTPEAGIAVGIKDGLVRLSVGLEAITDIKNDLLKRL